jgi:hypothetical protein
MPERDASASKRTNASVGSSGHTAS